MSVFLNTLTAFEVTSQSSLELVLDDGEKVQVDGVTTYRVRRPNSFAIENVTNSKVRDFIYDGRRFTISAPQLGYYAQVPAPATIRETLDAAYDKYGVQLPLEDLFRWSEPNRGRLSPLRSGFVVGDATVDGVQTVQYAFRQGDYDWQIWIRKGDQPVPVKVVIVDRTDESRPAFTARLSWNLQPTFNATAFSFQPGADAKPIRMAEAK